MLQRYKHSGKPPKEYEESFSTSLAHSQYVGSVLAVRPVRTITAKLTLFLKPQLKVNPYTKTVIVYDITSVCDYMLIIALITSTDSLFLQMIFYDVCH